MEILLHNLSEVFAVSIIHSLWQCLLIYLVLRIFLADIIRFSASAKYNITVTALFAATAWFVYTLFDQASHYSWQITAQASFTGQQHLPLITALKQFAPADERYEVTIEHYLPYISIVYAIGLLFHSLRLTSAWMQMQQLKQSLAVDQRLQIKLNELSALLNIKRQVVVSYAERIDIPCITGYLKPLIMLPLSLGTYLSAQEIETILLHELAHVKRNDYLVNLLQQVMSVILFFNPFIMLMNSMINRERENSCDDMVVALTQQPLIYAQALLKIEQSNARQLPLALAATGNKYHLLNRIERIMKTKKPITNIRHLVLAFTILMGSITSIAWLNPAIGNGKLSVKKVKPVIENLFVADTTAKKAPKATKSAKGAAKAAKSAGKMGMNSYYSKDGKAYYSYNPGMDDPKLDEMGKKMDKLGEILNKYYDSPEFKKISEDMDQMGKKIDAYYNSADYKKLSEQMEQDGKNIEAFYNNPALKQLQADQEKISREYSAAYSDNGPGEKLGKQMEAYGKKMEAYYNSDDFKKLYKSLQKKYNIPDNYVTYSDGRNGPDDNYKAFQAEVNKNVPADVKNASEEMKKLGAQMREYYNSPDRKAKTAQMRALGDSMRVAFNNPEIKKLQEDMRKLGEQMRNYTGNPEIKNVQAEMRKRGEEMRAYTNNPEIKKVQEQMHKLGEEMHAYTNTPEFKKRVEEWRKSMKAANWPNSYYNIEDVPAVPPVPAVAAPTPATPPDATPEVHTTPATLPAPPAKP